MKYARFCLLCACVPLTACRTTAGPQDPDEVGGTEAAEVRDFEVQSGEEALELLLAGNARFVAGSSLHDHQSRRRRAALTGGQRPFAVLLGCADSRVPPELIFDAGLGDLFVIRVAGNVAGTDEAGSIEYAVWHLGTQLVLVMGHEGCGAITAVIDHAEGEPLELTQLLASIGPGVSGVDETLPHEERVHLGVEANVREQLRRMRAIADRDAQARQVTFVGGVYELATGRVRILE